MEIPIKTSPVHAVEFSTVEVEGVLAKEQTLTTEPLNKKELALKTTGATREVAYRAMVAGLEAKSMTVDKFGEEHFCEDHSARLKAAELISRLNGDLKTDVVVDNRQVTVTGVGAEAMAELVEMVRGVSLQLEALREGGQQTGEIIDVDIQ